MLKIGTRVKGYGKVAAIGWVGERYYWLINRGTVSMLPASFVEPLVAHLTKHAPDSLKAVAKSQPKSRKFKSALLAVSG